jgi:Helix-turn-helix domain
MEEDVCSTNVYLTQDEVASRFRVSPSTVKNWRDRGLLDYFQALGSTRVLYPVESVEALERQSLKTNKKKEVVKPTEVKRERPEISTKPKKEWKI